MPLICSNEEVHDKHVVNVTVDYPCSGPKECGRKGSAEHLEHRLQKQMTLQCPGVITPAWML